MNEKDDDILAWIRAVRDERARKFNYDIRAMSEDLARHERESGRIFIQGTPRPAVGPGAALDLDPKEPGDLPTSNHPAADLSAATAAS